VGKLTSDQPLAAWNPYSARVQQPHERQTAASADISNRRSQTTLADHLGASSHREGSADRTEPRACPLRAQSTGARPGRWDRGAGLRSRAGMPKLMKIPS
jgi:hypothetical protein